MKRSIEMGPYFVQSYIMVGECILYGVLCVLSFMEIVFVCRAVLQKYNSPQLLLKDDI